MANRLELVNQILEVYSADELQDLCLGMNIIYQSLPGETRRAKARELVAFCSRRQKLPALVTLCGQQRPHLDWQPFAALEPMVTADTAEPAPASMSPGQIRIFLEMMGIPEQLQRNRYAEAQMDVYDSIWKALYQLKLAGDALWQEVSRENIYQFSQSWETARGDMEEHAIYLVEADYTELQRLMGLFSEYQLGKVRLLDIQHQQMLEYVDDQMAYQQIQHNRAHKEQYEAVLERVKASFRQRLSQT